MIWITIISIITISLSGCSTYIHPAFPIPLINVGYQSDEVAIAVDYFGVKHIARLECPTIGSDPCKLVYNRLKTGLPDFAYNWTPVPTGSTIHDVDIAVTDSGIAYITFIEEDYVSGDSILYGMRSDYLGTLAPIETTLPVTGSPIAVARGNVVYVVYQVNQYDNGSDTYYDQIKYLQLTNPAIGGYVDVCYYTVPCILHNAAVAWNGSLYVVYSYSSFSLRYADNYGDTGNMTNLHHVSTYFSSKADIDVNGGYNGGDPSTWNETVYIIYDDTRDFPGYSNGLFINYCPARSCTSQTIAVMPLPDGELWRLYGNPQITADVVNTAYYAFTALRVPSPNANVYAGLFQVGTTPPAPSQLTNDTAIESDARICLMSSIYAVGGWRSELGGGLFGDIAEYDTYLYSSRSVRHTISGLTEIDFSCNADWGAGIWNEQTGTVKQAWVSFNTYPALMPMIIK